MPADAASLRQYFYFEHGGREATAAQLQPEAVAKAINALLGAYVDLGLQAHWKKGCSQSWSQDVASYFQEVWPELTWVTRGNIKRRFEVEETGDTVFIRYQRL